jgi:acetyl esterase/lipase
LATSFFERLDPELAALLSGREPSPLARGSTDVALLRAAERAARTHPEVPGPMTVEDVEVLAGEGMVGVRLYRWRGAGAAPSVLFLHGGAFVVGDLESEHAQCIDMCRALEGVVVSVDYGLAPEHPFPVAADQAWATLRWMVSQADTLGVDPGRVAVAGISAGAALAAGLALRARDEGGPAIRFQLLDNPALDARANTGSIAAFFDVPAFNGRACRQMWRWYLGDDAMWTAVSPYAAPASATDLAGLPAAYIATAELDPLRDEGITYAVRLMDAAVPVELHHAPGAIHGCSLLPTITGRAMAAEGLRALASALAAVTPPSPHTASPHTAPPHAEEPSHDR